MSGGGFLGGGGGAPLPLPATDGAVEGGRGVPVRDTSPEGCHSPRAEKALLLADKGTSPGAEETPLLTDKSTTSPPAREAPLLGDKSTPARAE